MKVTIKLKQGSCMTIKLPESLFERRAAIERRNTPHHSYTSGSKRSSCLRT